MLELNFKQWLVVVALVVFAIASTAQTNNPAPTTQASPKPVVTPTPAPTPDPLAFTEDEATEANSIIREQQQIERKIRALHDELGKVADDDLKGFALVGLRLQKQVAAQQASEARGDRFIKAILPRCPNCYVDFNEMRLKRAEPPKAKAKK